jgi:hypothetical protein
MIFITRHFERVDGDFNNATVNEKILWKSRITYSYPKNMLSKIELIYRNANPFSINHNHHIYADKVINSLGSNKIDLIISSPFVRCMQTALKIKKNLRYGGKIHINYGLAELMDYKVLGLSKIHHNYIPSNEKYFLVHDGFNLNKLFHMSLDNFNLNRNLFVLDNTINIKNNTILLNETEPLNETNYDVKNGKYFKRIIQTIESIKKKYPTKNILLVTHGYSPVAFNLPSLRYGDVINITDKIKEPLTNYFSINYLKDKFL